MLVSQPIAESREQEQELRQAGGQPTTTTGRGSEMPLCLINCENKDVL